MLGLIEFGRLVILCVKYTMIVVLIQVQCILSGKHLGWCTSFASSGFYSHPMAEVLEHDLAETVSSIELARLVWGNWIPSMTHWTNEESVGKCTGCAMLTMSDSGRAVGPGASNGLVILICLVAGTLPASVGF